jgi:hypothetical protein
MFFAIEDPPRRVSRRFFGRAELAPTVTCASGPTRRGWRKACGLLQRFCRGDLNAKASKPDISARAGRQQLDRRDAQIAQYLRP